MNIVICIDGIQEGGKSATNVFKLYNMLEDRTSNQIAFYDRGITKNTPLRTITDPGRGIAAKIRRSYEFIFERFEQGDKIFLFGSGRGAAIVSILAEMIHYFGVLPAGHEELIEKAYSLFNLEKPEERKHKAYDFIAHHHTMWCKISFMGLWDRTLSSARIIDDMGFFQLKYRFHNLLLPETIMNCCHALAIDEERSVVNPAIFEVQTRNYQSLKQVWFPGAHGDVCGGYNESELSDITLQWMVYNAITQGLRINKRHRVHIEPNPDGFIHDPRLGWPGALFRKRPRSWRTDVYGKPVVHESVLIRKLSRQNSISNSYTPWISKLNYEVEPWPDRIRDGSINS